MLFYLKNPLEHSGLIASNDMVPKSAPSEPLEHSVPEGPQSWGDGFVSEVEMAVHLQSVCFPRVALDPQRVDDPLLEDRPEATGSRSDWRGYCCGCDWFGSTLVSHRMDT